MANYIQAGHFEASGAAVSLTWDKNTNPDFLLLINETKFATTSTNVMGFWFKDYANGDLSAVDNDTTAGMMGVKEVTNGITHVDSGVTYADTNNVTAASSAVSFSIGSAFQGADGDEVHFLAIWADDYSDLGDINA